MTTAHMSAFLCYRDPNRAIEWISDVLGFGLVREFRDAGALMHAELVHGDAVVCVQHDDRGYDVPAPRGDCVGTGLCMVVDDADVVATHERAVARGSTVLVAPQTTPWGNFRTELLDPEGRQWSVGTYLPGQPGDW